MNTNREKFQVVTVTLNPAIDRTVTISNFTAGAVNRVESVRSNPGGKGVNVASALADHGHDVARHRISRARQRWRVRGIVRPEENRRSLRPHRRANADRDQDHRPGSGRNDRHQLPRSGAERRRGQRCCARRSRRSTRSGSSSPAVCRPGSIRRSTATSSRALRQRGRKVLLDTSGAPFPLALEAKPTRDQAEHSRIRGLYRSLACLTRRRSSRPRAN